MPAYQQNLADFQYRGIPGNKRNLIDLVEQSLRMDRDIAQQNAATRQNDLSNDSLEMTRDQQQAIQPGVMSELRNESQTMQAPQGIPQGHPAMMAQQAPQGVDPYAAQAKVMADREALLQRNQGRQGALAVSPILAHIAQGQGANIKDRGDLAGDQFGLQSNRDFNAIIPDLDTIKAAGVKAMRGAPAARSIDAYNGMVSGVQSALVAKYPHLLQSKAYQDYMKDLEKLKPTPQPNSGVISMIPPSSSVMDNAAKRIANRESTISEEINKGRFSGAQAMQIHDDLVQRVQAIDPAFAEQDTESGAAFAKAPATRRALQGLENSYRTIGRLKDVYSKLNNTEFPTVNKAINAGRVAVGDVDAARATIAEVLGNDELTQAFSRGGVGSDKLRDMSAKLANYELSPAQMAAQFDELEHGLERSYNAFESQGGGYIKKLKTGAAPKVAPYQDPGKEARYQAWKKAHPNG